MAALTVGMVFGGVSPEHEVSIISTLQAAAALDRSRYRVVPLYISKDGRWYTGSHLLDLSAFSDLDAVVRRSKPVALVPAPPSKIHAIPIRRASLNILAAKKFVLDVLFLGLHGGAGENGGLQGLCETMGVPYTGSGVFGSAAGMDKVYSKMLCHDQGIPVVPFMSFRELEWADREEECMDQVEEELGYPVVVKPGRLGSSIGIAKASHREELDEAIEEAFRYDEKIVIERAVQDLLEVNCSVLGNSDSAVASVIEQPVRSTDELLTYQDKYMRGDDGDGDKMSARPAKSSADSAAGMASLDRIIPAPLDDDRTTEIRELAIEIFRIFECSGVARIDFMIDESDGQVYFNEINTIPGSFSFYLWEPSGIPFRKLVERLIELAMERHAAAAAHIRSYDVNLLSETSVAGLKGAKARG